MEKTHCHLKRWREKTFDKNLTTFLDKSSKRTQSRRTTYQHNKRYTIQMHIVLKVKCENHFHPNLEKDKKVPFFFHTFPLEILARTIK